jgi:hypothetical protein
MEKEEEVENFMERKVMRPIEEIETRFVGVSLPLSSPGVPRGSDAEKITATALLQKLIVRHLDGVKK